MISFKNFAIYLFLSVFKFMLVGLNYLKATSLSQVKEQKKMEIQLQKIEEEWKEAYRKHLEASFLFQVSDKELDTVLKKQFEVRSLRQEVNRDLKLARTNKLKKRSLLYTGGTGILLEVLRGIADKECQLMEKKWKLVESKSQVANESVSVANTNQLVALERFKTAGRRLRIVQIQYELATVELLCETEGATHVRYIIHSYLVDLNKKEIK